MSLDIISCLVKDVGADVNGTRLRDGVTPLYVAAQTGNLALVQCLLKGLGADVNQAAIDGTTPLCIAVQAGHLAVVRCLLTEYAADINQTRKDGPTPLYIAAQEGHLSVARFLVKECGADVNKAMHNGVTPLMIAARFEHEDMVTFLIKYGANVKDSINAFGTAADISRKYAAPGKQTEYLEARTHCANTGCDGTVVKKCAGCLKIYYCKRECQLAHWPAHKAACRSSAEVTGGSDLIERG
jgi:ankyrin repeat protein